MSTFNGNTYTHEFISWPSDEDWDRLWASNPHIWKYKAFPFFKYSTQTDPGFDEIRLPNGVTNQAEALIYMKIILETMVNSIPTVFHMIRDGDDAIGMRMFVKTPKYENNPVFIDILGADYQDDTAQLFIMMYAKEDNNSRAWSHDVGDLDIQSELLAHTGCTRYIMTIENQVNKNYWLQLSSEKNLPWAGTYVDDDTTVMHPLSTFGWPAEFVPNIGPPAE